jgi:hypothetical protein
VGTTSRELAPGRCLIDLGTLAVDEWTLEGLSLERTMGDGKQKSNKGVKLAGKKLAGGCSYQAAAAQLRQILVLGIVISAGEKPRCQVSFERSRQRPLPPVIRGGTQAPPVISFARRLEIVRCARNPTTASFSAITLRDPCMTEEHHLQ